MVHDDKSPAMACKPIEEDLVLHYYGELDGRWARGGGKPCAKL